MKYNAWYCGKQLPIVLMVLILVALVACTPKPTPVPPAPAPAPPPAPPPAPVPKPEPVPAHTYSITAKGISFDQKTLTVPAGAKVTIVFENQDIVPHNFALYEDATALKPIFVGKTISASQTEYEFTAPTTPGTYYFRCDVHPSINGSFIVVAP